MKQKAVKPRLLVGTTDTFPSIEYASGFRTADPVVFLQNGADKYLVVTQMEFGRACHTGKSMHVLTPETLNLQGIEKGRLREWTLRLLRYLKIRSVVVPSFFPFGIAGYLEKQGISVAIMEKELFPERAVKSVEEQRKIHEAQQAAVIAMRAAVAFIAGSDIDNAGCLRRHGRIITSEHVREIIARIIFEQKCIPKEIIVAGGAQAADPHENGSGVLRAGETIVMDIFPKHMMHGYWGDLTRTVVRGSASPFMKRVYLAVKAAQIAALARVRAGVRCSTVHQAAVDEFNRRGLYNSVSDGRGTGFIHSTGHGVGLSIHEAPSVSTAEGRLKTGNVITIEPGLYYPGVGGVRIEDTIVVTPTGWRYLVPCEKKFEV